MTASHGIHGFGSNFGNNVPFLSFLNAVEPNVEPFPTFDLEINKEDKDKDIDHPKVHKDPRVDNTDDEKSSVPNESE